MCAPYFAFQVRLLHISYTSLHIHTVGVLEIWKNNEDQDLVKCYRPQPILAVVFSLQQEASAALWNVLG